MTVPVKCVDVSLFAMKSGYSPMTARRLAERVRTRQTQQLRQIKSHTHKKAFLVCSVRAFVTRCLDECKTKAEDSHTLIPVNAFVGRDRAFGVLNA